MLVRRRASESPRASGCRSQADAESTASPRGPAMTGLRSSWANCGSSSDIRPSRATRSSSDATSIASLDTSDKFTLAAVDRMRLALDEMAFPLQPIRMDGDPMAEDSPFHVLWITPRQWYDFWTATSGSDWRALQANAFERKNNFNHPIFKGDSVMWNGILIKKQPRPIRFNASTVVTVCTNSADAATTTSTAAVRVERAILLGAQALADAYGATGGRSGGYFFNMTEETVDHGNREEMSIAWMNGKAKIRFQGTDGRVNDHGVMVLDTAVSTT